MAASKDKTVFGSESLDDRKKRMRYILSRLRREFPEAACALVHTNPLELLVSTILSAQCTDKRVNMVTTTLFLTYRTAHEFAAAPMESLINIIRSTGFYRNKAKSIKSCAAMLVEKYDGKVPNTIEELVQLPGVGRKTANVVLGTAFGIPGLPVDTHVRRIANLLQFTDSEDPDVIEQHLCAVIAKNQWIEAGHLFIWHGRKTCVAPRPKCGTCRIAAYCPSKTLSSEIR